MKGKWILSLFTGIFIIFFSITPVFAQKFAQHNLGKFAVKLPLNHNLGDLKSMDFSDKGMWYPNGFYESQILERNSELMVMKNYTTMEGDEKPLIYTPGAGFYGIYVKEYRKYAPPTVVVNGVTVSSPFTGIVDKSIPSDIFVDMSYKMIDEMGVQFFNKSYSYSNPNHDDYVIFDITLKFTGDIDEEMGQDLPDQTVEFAWGELYGFDMPQLAQERCKVNWHSNNGWATWDTYTNYTGKPLLVNDGQRKDLIISYYYGYDSMWLPAPAGYEPDDVPRYYDSRGFPDAKNGMFLFAQIPGFATLYADKSADEPVDDPENQPVNVGWMTDTGYLSENWPGGDQWQFLTRKDLNYKDGWIENNIDPRDVGRGGQENCLMKQSYGPYKMSIDDDVRSVIAVGCGMIDEDLCWSEGRKWYNWYWDLPGEKLDDEGKNALIATGIDSLFQAMDRAYWTFNRGYDIPDPPPAPDLEVTDGPDQIEIKWGYPDESYFKDPDTGVDDFYKWRLYRKKGAYYVYDDKDQFTYYKYELIGEFDRNTTSYIDKDVIRGVQYHYCVTAVDDGSQNKDGLFPGQKLESSYYANRNLVGVSAYKPGLDVSEQVVVVPNPYSISEDLHNKMNWPGSPNEIRFINLPAYCTIRIYTATGELVKTIEHTSGTGDEPWVNLKTDSNQYPVSGVYIAVIDNARDNNGNPLPRKIVKFILVR